jgi:hypothetical protein
LTKLFFSLSLLPDPALYYILPLPVAFSPFSYRTDLFTSPLGFDHQQTFCWYFSFFPSNQALLSSSLSSSANSIYIYPRLYSRRSFFALLFQTIATLSSVHRSVIIIMSPTNNNKDHQDVIAAATTTISTTKPTTNNNSGGIGSTTTNHVHHKKNTNMLERLGFDLQVKLGSYLRAQDLSAVHRTNRYFWQNRRLQHAIVVYCAEQGMYDPKKKVVTVAL